MEKVRFILYKAKRICYVDFSNASIDEMLTRIKEAQRLIASEPPNSVLTLTDFTNSHYDREVSNALKEYAKSNKPYVKAAAVVGITGLKEIMLNAVTLFTRRSMTSFGSLEEAKEWLVTIK